MSVYQQASTSITNLDGGTTNYTGMVLRNSRGMGDAANLKRVEDYVAPSANALTNVGSTIRLVRIPTGAIVKKVTIYSDGPLDTNSSAQLALDFNIAFSDANTSAVGAAANDGTFGNSVDDGTPANYAGQIPTTVGNAVTTVTAYSSPNILFGTYTVQSHTAGIPWGTDITLGGATGLAGNNYTIADMQLPLWNVFGFKGGQGYAQDPGGFFDLMAYVSVVALTAGAHNLWASVDYIEA